MKEELKNYAYIDGNNLYRGIESLGWKIDYKRLRVWLKDKYNINKAYIFIGLVPKYKDLYTFLQEAGFTLIFKETVYDGNGKIKGNCDADLVLRCLIDFYEDNINSVVIITSDGDYAGLIKFLKEKNKLRAVLSPSLEKKCSILIKRLNPVIVYLNNIKEKIRLK
ncbi:MAG TPA: NYN domain-containing protein [Candidatus Pacearchaeota archaeon]|nr:NYN domain-containing protein [Candidatus Parcubacteria bacterium]HOC53859.1 NYN domain-containing protein [Candidatus Pacearchaeota archaeon]HQM24576.1 NYN domain-containing protein [Candidatus Pacearchaeota archaeon]